jgi:hypothetical protein
MASVEITKVKIISEGSEVWIGPSFWHGQLAIDARTWLLNAAGEWIATKSGLRLSPDQARQVARAMIATADAVDETLRGERDADPDPNPDAG